MCLDFDHLDGADKKFQIADALRLRVGLSTLKAELEKCEVRCANCHRKRHRASKWANVGKDSKARICF